MTAYLGRNPSRIMRGYPILEKIPLFGKPTPQRTLYSALTSQQLLTLHLNVQNRAQVRIDSVRALRSVSGVRKT